MDAELVLASYWKQRIGRGRRDDATVLEEVEWDGVGSTGLQRGSKEVACC
jgi:hypothetical protein